MKELPSKVLDRLVLFRFIALLPPLEWVCSFVRGEMAVQSGGLLPLKLYAKFSLPQYRVFILLNLSIRLEKLSVPSRLSPKGVMTAMSPWIRPCGYHCIERIHRIFVPNIPV